MKEGKIIGFYKMRKIFFGLSSAIMIIGIIFAVFKGVVFDIQFTGGALLSYSYDGEMDENKAADIATQLLDRPVSPQLTVSYADGSKRLVLNIAGKYGVDPVDQAKLESDLKAAFPNSKLQLSEAQMVEKFFGDKFMQKGVIALVLSTLLVLCYVWIRFKLMGGLSAGVTAVIALVHDCFVVFFTCVIFGLPIGDNFVAVALSIIGYSINDTIVIYDRIRENAKIYNGFEIETISDLSISQSMMRSVMTNLCVMISVSLVYILAFANSIESIQAFALPMAIGSISGCYSTICIAGPIWVMWKKRKGNNILFVEKEKKKETRKYY
jgi:preprotein translocase SecF subunit